MNNIKNFIQFITEAKSGMTKAQQAGHDFSTGRPYIEKDRKGRETYWETSRGYWVKREYDARGKVISTESGKKSLKKVAQ